MSEAVPALAMKPDEGEMLLRHLKPGVRYLEFGAGGSTFVALAAGVARCDSVESDPAWIEKLRGFEAVRAAEAEGRLGLHAVDIGPVIDWGMPADARRQADWPNYFLRIWGELQAEPDVVLIDGRFRTACGLLAMALGGEGTVILMHDFYEGNPMRRNYKTLLEVADIAEQATQLVRLVRKSEVSARQLLARMAAVWTDWG